jgi:hypothetical protein
MVGFQEWRGRGVAQEIRHDVGQGSAQLTSLLLPTRSVIDLPQMPSWPEVSF